MASIELQGVCKTYPGGVSAVRDFTLAIKDREFIVLVGPSGCGKSTVLRMIAGLEDISSGDLLLDGQRINDVPARNRNVAMVFQSYALYPHMTVFENMAYGLKLRKTPKQEIKDRIHEAAGLLSIERLLDRRPGTLSGGERQRVALGRAIVRHPAVFLLDEPLSNLDAKLRSSMRVELRRLHERLGTTFLYVTHDQTEAMTMGDRIVVMEKGVIRQADTPHEIYHHPQNVFTAGFIGSPQMNLMSGKVTLTDGRPLLLLGQTAVPLEGKSADWEPYRDRDVTAGIRPEDLTLSGSGTAQEALLTCTVSNVESLGNESYLYLTHENEQLIASVPGDCDLTPGETVTVALRLEKLHLFDAQTGERLRKEAL